MPKVKALYVYPVKSLKGISLTTADVSSIGKRVLHTAWHELNTSLINGF